MEFRAPAHNQNIISPKLNVLVYSRELNTALSSITFYYSDQLNRKQKMRSHMCSLRSEIWKQKDDCQNKKMWTIIMCPVLNDWNVCQNIEFWRGHLWKCRYIKVCKVIQMKLYLGCVAHVPKQKPLRIIFQATFRNVHRSVDRTLFSFVLFGSFRNKKKMYTNEFS